MAQFQNMIITRAGLDMIAQSQAGGTLIFTKGKLGDGQIGDQSIPDLTDLINAKMSVELSSVTAKTEGHVEVRFIVDNTDLDVGFFVREVGIFAKVNDEGVEKLYGYANAGNYTNYLADKTVPIDSIITKIDLVVGNASNVAFTTDKSIVYVTLEDMENALNTHDAGADAHEPAFAAHNADEDAHKDFTGATAEAAGKRGMVPAPAAGTANRYLKADGTWGTIDTMNGASSSAAGSAGLVPAPAQNQQKNFLTGAGVWQAIATTEQAQAGTDDSAPMTALKVKQAINALTNAIPIGTILAFAGNDIPEGFLECNGAGISASTYSGLYAVIGNTYGGDSATFNLPNIQTGRIISGDKLPINFYQNLDEGDIIENSGLIPWSSSSTNFLAVAAAIGAEQGGVAIGSRANTTLSGMLTVKYIIKY